MSLIQILLVCVILLMISAFFSVVETAFTAVSVHRIKFLAKSGGESSSPHIRRKIKRKSIRTLELLENYDRLLSSILIGNNIANLSLSALAAVSSAKILSDKFSPDVSALVTTVVLTLVVITFGEIIPKTFAQQNPQKVCFWLCDIVFFVKIVFTPFTFLFSLLQNFIVKITGGEKHQTLTEEELVHIVGEIEAQGVLEEAESDLVKSALAFDETSVKNIITPRVKVVAVSKDDSMDCIYEVFKNEGYSRIPVYEEDVDHICGVINIKNFLPFYIECKTSDRVYNVEEIISKCLFVTETRKIPDVFKAMQRDKIHLAVVVDQYGGTAGIVTLEDIVEELVGDIWDEGDEPFSESVVLEKHENEIVLEVPGSFHKKNFYRYCQNIKELEEINLNGESQTVGGAVLELFGRIPAVGESINIPGGTVKILSLSGNSIGKICIKVFSE